MHHLPCDNTLLTRIQQNLAQFEPDVHDAKGLKKAAVAITVVPIVQAPQMVDIPFEAGWEGNAAIVLTQRASKLRKHAGQWALPGGRMEVGETAVQTALRELEEEVNLSLAEDAVIGRLDDFTTRSGYVMSPIIIWGGVNAQLMPNPDEVHSVHRIPLAEFMRDDAPILKQTDDANRPVLLMPVGHSWIAAPTGALLYQFREVGVLGKQTRVAHFEQPYFAWK